jgi:hypothetical protein
MLPLLSVQDFVPHYVELCMLSLKDGRAVTQCLEVTQALIDVLPTHYRDSTSTVQGAAFGRLHVSVPWC